MPFYPASRQGITTDRDDSAHKVAPAVVLWRGQFLTFEIARKENEALQSTQSTNIKEDARSLFFESRRKRVDIVSISPCLTYQSDHSHFSCLKNLFVNF